MAELDRQTPSDPHPFYALALWLIDQRKNRTKSGKALIHLVTSAKDNTVLCSFPIGSSPLDVR